MVGDHPVWALWVPFRKAVVVGGDGYTIDLADTQSAADTMSGIGDCADAADIDLMGMGTLPVAEAGESVNGQLTSFQSAWHGVLTELKKEMAALSSKAHGTVTTYTKVDARTAAVLNKMRQFEN